jgi:dTDP-4-dehydrorhamnose reductase
MGQAMQYAVLGATGQLAAELSERLGNAAVSLTRTEADLTQPETLRRSLSAARPSVVFNCAAYNYVDRAEGEPSEAFAVNAFGVRQLALICRELDCVLVHFSSDYVFGLDHSRKEPYREEDAPGPESVYGLSKLAGEYFVRSLCPKHFVIRTCGLYGLGGRGGKGDNFVEKLLRLAQAGKPLRVVADQICTPSYTADVAEGAIALVELGRYGLYHLTNSGSCSWYEFANAIFTSQSMRPHLSAIASAELAAPARRPGYSVLAMEAYTELALRQPRQWRDALSAYLQARAQKLP